MSSAYSEDDWLRLVAYFRDQADFTNDRACYEMLVAFLHPNGLACPRCQATTGLRVHRRHREPVIDFICANCFRVFNAWTGTAIQGVHRPPGQILYVMSRVIEVIPTARIARELGCHRRGVLLLRRRLLRLIPGRLLRRSPWGCKRANGGAEHPGA
jgi:transposase-like protein